MGKDENRISRSSFKEGLINLRWYDKIARNDVKSNEVLDLDRYQGQKRQVHLL